MKLKKANTLRQRHRVPAWALGLLLAVCALAFTYPQLPELEHMNQLPRNMKLTAFDPHRPGFECVHEASKVPPIDPQAQEWFEQGLALSSYDHWYEDRDWAGAAALWHKAAERQHWKAMMNLASLYANGRGEGKFRVERDLERAVLITEEAMRLPAPMRPGLTNSGNAARRTLNRCNPCTATRRWPVSRKPRPSSARCKVVNSRPCWREPGAGPG